MDESMLKHVKEVKQVSGRNLDYVNRLLNGRWVLLEVRVTQLSEEVQKKGTYKTFIRNSAETTYILGRIV